MSIPTVGSDAEFFWHDLDGGKHGPYQTEREGWRALAAMLAAQRDGARAEVTTERGWHAYYEGRLDEEIGCRQEDNARRSEAYTEMRAERDAVVANAQGAPVAVVVGALFDFLGFLTTLPVGIKLGAKHNAAPAADLLHTFLLARGIDTNAPGTDADVRGWQARIG